MNKLDKLGLAAVTMKILRDAGVETIDVLASMSVDSLRALSLSMRQIRSIQDRLHLIDGGGTDAGRRADETREAHGSAEADDQQLSLISSEADDLLVASPTPAIEGASPRVDAVAENQPDAAGNETATDVFDPVLPSDKKDLRAKAKTDDDRARASAAAHERSVAARPAPNDARIAALRVTTTMNVVDAADLYGVSSGVIYDMCKRGEIPHIRCGQRIRIKTRPVLRGLGIE